MNKKLSANPSALVLDGSFLRLVRSVATSYAIFGGQALPPSAQKYAAIAGAWGLICDRPLDLLNRSKEEGDGNSFFGGGSSSGGSSTTTSAPENECDAFLRSFKQLGPLWSPMSSLFMGKILYYPDTALTRSLMRRVEHALDWQSSFQSGIVKLVELMKLAGANYKSKDSNQLQTQLVANGMSQTDAAWLVNFVKSPAYDILTTMALPSFANYLNCFKYNATSPGELYRETRLEGFNDVNEMVAAGLKLIEDDMFLGAVEFENPDQYSGSELPNFVKYSIRMDPSDLDNNERRVKDRPINKKPRRDPFQQEIPYFTSGFIYLQDAVDKSIIGSKSGNDEYSLIGNMMQQFPFPCYMIDNFIQNLANQILLFVVLGWIFPASMIVKSVTLEKEKKLREISRIMGISPGLHFLSWFIFWITLLLISVILFVILIRGSGVFVYSNPGIIFILMVLYACSVISFGFFISSFFSKANIASVVGGLVFFLTYITYGAIANGNPETLNLSRMMLSSLLPNVCLGYAWRIVGNWELTIDGVQWSNIRKPQSDEAEDQYTLSHSLVMFIIDAVLYYFIAWYVEHVFPGEYGVPRPFYFMFQPSFWCGEKCAGKKTKEEKQNTYEESSNGAFKIEKEPSHLPMGASIDSIMKVYDLGLFEKMKMKCCKGSGSSKKKAVDNLSLNMYEGQITALLGHNGAGKTTTMSIMTGLIAATSGSVTIDGHDVATELEQVRKVLGFCPQFNVLYDDLTVGEHLYFYARVRGIDKKLIKDDIERMLIDTNLTAKRNEPVRSLSGGMRRRLSIAIAFIGNSKCVILDEPTAGVDPFARRSLWDLLSKFRKDRTIVLSTHHMDEAEILADRIAIMSQGKLQTVRNYEKSIIS